MGIITPETKIDRVMRYMQRTLLLSFDYYYFSTSCKRNKNKHFFRQNFAIIPYIIELKRRIIMFNLVKLFTNQSLPTSLNCVNQSTTSPTLKYINQT